MTEGSLGELTGGLLPDASLSLVPRPAGQLDPLLQGVDQDGVGPGLLVQPLAPVQEAPLALPVGHDAVFVHLV